MIGAACFCPCITVKSGQVEATSSSSIQFDLYSNTAYLERERSRLLDFRLLRCLQNAHSSSLVSKIYKCRSGGRPHNTLVKREAPTCHLRDLHHMPARQER